MFVMFGEILSNYGEIKLKFSKFRSNLTNVGLTTNGRLASVALALLLWQQLHRTRERAQLTEQYTGLCRRR